MKQTADHSTYTDDQLAEHGKRRAQDGAPEDEMRAIAAEFRRRGAAHHEHANELVKAQNCDRDVRVDTIGCTLLDLHNTANHLELGFDPDAAELEAIENLLGGLKRAMGRFTQKHDDECGYCKRERESIRWDCGSRSGSSLSVRAPHATDSTFGCNEERRDLVLELLDEAARKTSSDYEYPFTTRQLFYTMRRIDGRLAQLDYGSFQKIVTEEWERR